VPIREQLRGELIDIVEWLEESPDTLVWRFARPDNEIKNGAQLVVRPGQVAVFVEQGDVADVFLPGRHELTTRNLPVLSRLRGWKYGFESPFKAEVVFASTRQFLNQKWGTKSPVITNDPQFGPARLRAYGTFGVRVHDAAQLVRELVGAQSSFAMAEITEQLRDLVTARASDELGEGTIPLLQLAANYAEIGDRVAERIRTDLRSFGLDVVRVVVENISVPTEVEQALDQRTRMGVIGDVGAYAQLQAADALRDAARNPGGVAASGAGIGLGLAIAQQAGAAVAAAPPRTAAAYTAGPAEPPPIPPAALFHIVVDGARQGPFDAAALVRQAAAGSLGPETLVWRPGMAAWAPASTVPEVAALLR
jgi:membrane protease subunit (stomatin/prohibitin family)